MKTQNRPSIFLAFDTSIMYVTGSRYSRVYPSKARKIVLKFLYRTIFAIPIPQIPDVWFPTSRVVTYVTSFKIYHSNGHQKRPAPTNMNQALQLQSAQGKKGIYPKNVENKNNNKDIKFSALSINFLFMFRLISSANMRKYYREYVFQKKDF